MFRLAHLSDLHATPVGVTPLTLSGKRFWGWLSWTLRRRHAYRPEVLAAVVDDLHRQAPDHVVVTGDLTNVSLPDEFRAARGWLERIGSPDELTVVPGNHDAYVPLSRESSWAQWSEWMRGDGAVEASTEFPSLRVRDGVALIGVSSAVPTRTFSARGALGPVQLERLEKMLWAMLDSPLCRVLLVHHPITPGVEPWRRSLADAAALRGILARTGVDLVLHGHTHRTTRTGVDGPDGPIPVWGVRASSNLGDGPHTRSQYHLYEIERVPGARFRIRSRRRCYEPATGCFAEGESLG